MWITKSEMSLVNVSNSYYMPKTRKQFQGIFTAMLQIA